MSRNVLFIRSDVKLAGPARLMLSSACALRDAGVNVTFATGGGAMVEQIEGSGFRHITIPELRLEGRSLGRTAKSALQLLRLCLKHRFAVVHSFNLHAGISAFPGAKLTCAELFNTVLGNGKERLLAKVPIKLVAVSNSVRDKLISCGVPAKRIEVIYNATLDSRFLAASASELDQILDKRALITPITFVSVAMFTGGKGHAEIVEAAHIYRKAEHAPEIKIKLVGDGRCMEEIKAQVASYGMADVFEFVGASNSVEAHLDTSHVFIHLAEMETFGMVLAEAGARGLPCIASNVGGIPEVVLDGQSGILVDRNDAAHVADCMAMLAGSREMRDRLGRAGAARARALFSQHKMGQDLLALYGFGDPSPKPTEKNRQPQP
ncbi:glycosyltransferase family 4 protein [Roseovarius nanhaiticus]|uniref:glycosyltransferase family 4 protein n=1 Tax=Roseovarius nanhaiticus TaxID=573024 RepID=UPI0024937377|nr:glycosyltransferase family 4 protein [Roseovarius nanhaiticus]